MRLDDFTDLATEYAEESGEFLDSLERFLLRLEGRPADRPDPALTGDLLGHLHTFKGNSGMMGFSSLQTFAHRLEDLFKASQCGALTLEPAMVGRALSWVNVLRRAMGALSHENPEGPDLSEETVEVGVWLAGLGAAPEGRPDPAERSASGGSEPIVQKTGVLRVDFKRLDHLLDLMGELVIFRTRLGRVEAQLRAEFGEKGTLLDLAAASEQIGKVTSELHEAIMKVRMLPIRQVFMRFPRTVRDAAVGRGLEVNLEFSGEGTELDKTVIDEIGEPLLHLVRNAVDHGIESPDERRATGKPSRGTVRLHASQASSHIILTVEDDGRGIDPEKLRKRAVAAGLMDEAEASRREVLDLLCMPGLSTAGEITESSGRGIGMDVVRRSLGRISGSLEVQSEPGLGTRFTIKLPLTLAIISALMVEASGELYALPLSTVVESIRVRDGEIHVVNQREVIRTRDQVLPLVRLGRFFNLPGGPPPPQPYVVVAQSNTGRLGIVVDSLVGRQEVVIKALDESVGGGGGLAGATILGDGRVVLVVDVAALVESARRRPPQERALA